MGTGLPTPYEYLDHRQFLEAWFTAKKRAWPKCSHRWFAGRAGTSVSLLHHVMRGKRDLSPTAAEGFIRAMALREGEATFFRLLVAFGQADNAAEKSGVWAKIRTTRRFREARPIGRGAYDYLSTWYIPVIRELATTAAFEPDATWISGVLQPPITPAQAQGALDVLKTLGMLVEEDGAWRVAEVSVATPPEVQDLAVRQYHEGMLTLASESIDRFSPAERHLLGITVAVPSAEIAALKQEATALLQQLMDRCDASTAERDRVVQINLHLFPTSRPTGEES